jgi:pantothenate kinase
MSIVVSIIGWLIVAEGGLFLLRPELLGPIVRFFNRTLWMYALSILRIAVAVVFLLGAVQCRIRGVIVGLGILLLITGVAGLITKHQMYDAILQWWQERNLTTVRLVAAVVMLTGAVIVYCA